MAIACTFQINISHPLVPSLNPGKPCGLSSSFQLTQDWLVGYKYTLVSLSGEDLKWIDKQPSENLSVFAVGFNDDEVAAINGK